MTTAMPTEGSILSLTPATGTVDLGDGAFVPLLGYAVVVTNTDTEWFDHETDLTHPATYTTELRPIVYNDGRPFILEPTQEWKVRP